MLNKRLLKEAGSSGFLLASTIIISTFAGFLTVLQAGYFSRIINDVFLGGQDLVKVRPLLFILLGVIIIRAIFLWISEMTAYFAAARIKFSMRKELLAHLYLLGPLYVKGRQTGELVNLLSEGIEALEAYFARYLPQLVLAALIPLVILGFIFPLDILSGLILFCTAPLIPLFMILIGKWAEAVTQKQWDVLNRMNAHFFDVLKGLATLKLFGREMFQKEIISLVSNRFRKTTLEVLRIAFLSTLTLELIATLSTAIVAVSLGLRLVYGKVSFEEAFFILLLAPEFYLPLRNLGSQYHAGISAVSAALDMFRILDEPLWAGSEAKRLLPPKATRLEISFQNVYFCYDKGARSALEGVSFEICHGETVALIGPSGGGKSTITNLLLGFIEPERGQILINDIPLNRIKREDLYTLIAYVPQNPYLFQGTILDNIRLANPVASLEEVKRAAELANAHRFIEDLPQGYDTSVGEGGAGLSGGQIQRLAIARAFLKNAPLIILDEATAGLDPENETEVQEALGNLLKNRSVLVIAHNLWTVYKLDRILVLDKGKIVEAGSHQELSKKKGVYYSLVAALEV